MAQSRPRVRGGMKGTDMDFDRPLTADSQEEQEENLRRTDNGAGEDLSRPKACRDEGRVICRAPAKSCSPR